VWDHVWWKIGLRQNYWYCKVINIKIFVNVYVLQMWVGLHWLILRAGTLLHISSLVRCLMQCHVVFLLMWRKERGERENGRCFAKQPPHKLKIRNMRQPFYELLLTCNLELYFYYMHKLTSYDLLRDNLENDHCICCLLSRLKITWHYMTRPMHLPWV
jgi:hypothetical protein